MLLAHGPHFEWQSLRRKDAAGQSEGKVSFLPGDHVAICLSLSHHPSSKHSEWSYKNHFTEQKTEAGEVICPRPQSQ